MIQLTRNRENLCGLALAPDGSVAAVVTCYGDSIWAYAARVARTGEPLPVGDLYDDSNLNTYDASLAMAADGHFLVAWDQEPPGFDQQLLSPLPPDPIFGRFFDAGGSAVEAAEFDVNRRVPGSRTSPQLVTLPAGGFLAIWEDQSGQDGSGSGIFGRLLDSDANPYGGDFQVNLTSAGNQLKPVLAVGSAAAIAVWLNQPANTIVARRIAVP